TVALATGCLRVLIAVLVLVCSVSTARAQSTDCVVTGYLFNSDASPAVNAQFHATRVERDGSAFRITPVVLSTDAGGGVSFAAPRGSILWIAGSAVGSSQAGDVGLLIPDNAAADVNLLASTARPPVSRLSLTAAATPVVLRALTDSGINVSAAAPPPPPTVQSINGRTGAVTLTAGDVAATLVSSGQSTTTGPTTGGLVYSTSSALTSLANASAGKILAS